MLSLSYRIHKKMDKRRIERRIFSMLMKCNTTMPRARVTSRSTGTVDVTGLQTMYRARDIYVLNAICRQIAGFPQIRSNDGDEKYRR